MSCDSSFSISDIPLGRTHNTLGHFIHYGLKTFNGQAGFGDAGNQDPTTEWPSSEFDPTITLTQAMVRDWLTPVIMCGGTYAVFTAKHVDGWCAWPTLTQTGDVSEYNITGATAPANTLDLVQMFVTACNDASIQPMLYFGISDRNFNNISDWRMDSADALTFMKAQISELLTDYGTIGGIWLDVVSWTTPSNNIALYNHIKSIQPDCLVMSNFPDTRISYDGCHSNGSEESDLVDGRGDVFVGEEDLAPSGYSMPFQTCARIDRESAWFSHDDTSAPTESASELAAEINNNLDQGLAYLLNAAPGPNGKIIPLQGTRLKELAIELGVISNSTGINHE